MPWTIQPNHVIKMSPRSNLIIFSLYIFFASHSKFSSKTKKNGTIEVQLYSLIKFIIKFKKKQQQQQPVKKKKRKNKTKTEKMSINSIVILFCVVLMV